MKIKKGEKKKVRKKRDFCSNNELWQNVMIYVSLEHYAFKTEIVIWKKRKTKNFSDSTSILAKLFLTDTNNIQAIADRQQYPVV